MVGLGRERTATVDVIIDLDQGPSLDCPIDMQFSQFL